MEPLSKEEISKSTKTEKIQALPPSNIETGGNKFSLKTEH